MAGDKATTEKATNDSSITTKDGVVMTKGDVEFLMACMQNTTGGQILIDQAGVATALNMKNPRSVGNRISVIKKKYNLPLGTGSAKSSADGGSPSVPKTTPKAIKKPATPRKKKVATRAKDLEEDAVKSEEDGEGEETMEVEDPVEDDAELDGEES